MRCPTIKELPVPPDGKTGWPWIEESPQSKESMIVGSRWPRISIITPSLNQANYLEETIRSVLLQGYPNLEYIIIDGGSTDHSIEIIKRYGNWLTYWISESDYGQSHAINKGFTKASGDIYAYLNSDDLYEPEALKSIAAEYVTEGRPHLLAGECIIIKEQSLKRSFKPWWPSNLSYFIRKTFSSTFAQPASFWTKNIFNQLGGFDESLNYCFDKEFFLRAGLRGITPHFVPKKIARFREHSDSKTMKHGIKFHKETIKILCKHSSSCGIDNNGEKKIKKNIENEIKYIEIFSLWKKKSRKYGILYYLKMVLYSPSLLLQRKILGQGRRLFFYKTKNVDELKVI